MSTLIRNRSVVTDSWCVLQADDDIAPEANVIVPLSVWREQQKALAARAGSTGVWLAPEDEPADIGELPSLIAVHFPVFTDGRGYSTARLLRQRYGFKGELRAIGDVLCDQLYELARCGFDSFALRSDQDAAQALRAFDDFSDSYQSAADHGALFERRTYAGRDAP